MKAVRFLLSSAAAAGLASSANAQPPINMVAPPPPVPIGIAPQPAVPAGDTIWSKLGISQAQREFCRRNTCRTPFGQAMNTIVSPFSRLSGGLIPGFCPTTPSLAELQDPGAVGAAAKVKQDRAGAEERIKAVKYLAGVDCHYWPEAEDALIGALRNDRNECVRYEAAVALASGCCCTPKVVIALSNTVGCGTSDGGFMEKSARVRQAAEVALEKCMPCCACGDLPVLELDGGKKEGEKGKGERPQGDKNSSLLPEEDNPSAELKAYYKKVAKLPKSVVLNYAMKALEIGRQVGDRVNAPSNTMDLMAAGIPAPTQASGVNPRPANLWDLITGDGQPTATIAYTQMPVRTSTPTQKSVAVNTAPKTLVSVLTQSPEPPQVKKLPPAVVTPAPIPAPAPIPVVASTPVPAPVPRSTSLVSPFTSTAPVPAPAKLPVTVPVKTEVQKAVVFKPSEPKKVPVAEPIVAEPKKVPMAEPIVAEPKPVQPAGIARVYTPPAAVAAPVQPEMLVPAFPPAAAPVQSGAMMAEPLPLRPAIPARR